jgi:ribosomal protein S27AE
MNLVKECPRCGHMIPNDEVPGQYPGALSRYDNETEICSKCGTREALYQMAHGGYRAPHQGTLPPPEVDLAPYFEAKPNE